MQLKQWLRALMITEQQNDGKSACDADSDHETSKYEATRKDEADADMYPNPSSEKAVGADPSKGQTKLT